MLPGCVQRLSIVPQNTSVGFAVAAILGLQHPTPVLAQEAELSEVIVTSSRRDESIQNTPYNMAAISSDVIQDLRLDKISDAAHWVPGVAVQDQGSAGPGTIVMRGLSVSPNGASGGGVNGAGSSVAVYFGEIPLYLDLKLIDIARVETLLGPQGTLFGSGTLGGVVRYIPKEPDLTTFEGSVHVRAAALKGAPQGGYDGDGVRNIPLIDGQLGFRAVIGYYHDPGFINDTRLVRTPGVSLTQPDLHDTNAVAANLRTERGVDFDHTFTGRFSLLYRPNDTFEGTILYAHQITRSDGVEATNAQSYGAGPFDRTTRIPELAKRESDLVGLVLTAHLGFADLSSSSSWALRRFDQTLDTTDQYLGSGYEAFPSFVAFDLSEINRTQYTEELRMVSTGQGPLTWVAGLFYEHFIDDFIDHEFMPGYPAFIGIDRPDQLDAYGRTFQRFSDKAVFGEVSYHFTDAWQVTVGGRWFHDQLSSTDSEWDLFDTGGPSTGVDLQTTGGSNAKSDAIYKLNTSYRFTPDLMAYTTASEGYRAGTINTFPVCEQPINPNIAHNCLLPSELGLKPDTTRNYELGVRSTWFDKRLTLNGAVYYVTWNDLRVQGTSFFGKTFLTNGSSARSQGLELQFQSQLPLNLTLLGSYTFNDARMTAPARGLLSDANGPVTVQSGDRLTASPRQMGALHVQYVRALPGAYTFDADYGINAQSNIYSKIGLRASGEVLPGYAVQSASIGVSKSRWRASLFVENLTNKYAYTGVNMDSSFLQEFGGFLTRDYYHSVLKPREIGAELQVKF